MIAPSVEETISSMPAEIRRPRRLLFVGHCIATKGVFKLVEACCSIQGVKLVLVGAIKEDVRKALFDIAGGGTWLEIMGEIPYVEVMKEMLKCDIFVLPTYTEGFPNVIIEAMVCGCAIITTPVGAIPEMLEEEYGKSFSIVVDPQKFLHLNQAIVKILNDEVFKQKCRENVQKRVKERYAMSTVWNDLTRIWKELSTN